METGIYIYWKDIIHLIQNKKELPESIEIDFRQDKIDLKNVSLLNSFGFRVPENLIQYNDDDIDFSDDPDITDVDLETGKISWAIKANFLLDPEIKQWIMSEKIEINSLIPKLMKNFYETVKHIKNNAAL